MPPRRMWGEQACLALERAHRATPTYVGGTSLFGAETGPPQAWKMAANGQRVLVVLLW